MYVPSYIKCGSGFQKLIAWRLHKPTSVCSKSRNYAYLMCVYSESVYPNNPSRAEALHDFS
jgi:hypothetical protein